MIKARQRQNLVTEIEKHFALDEHVREAFLEVDRESFVPSQFKHLAYQLEALPLAASQWISSPLTVAKMTQHLELDGVDSVLEVGCGSGYQAAILSKICRRVFTIERIDTLLKEAKSRLKTKTTPKAMAANRLMNTPAPTRLMFPIRILRPVIFVRGV